MEPQYFTAFSLDFMSLVQWFVSVSTPGHPIKAENHLLAAMNSVCLNLRPHLLQTERKSTDNELWPGPNPDGQRRVCSLTEEHLADTVLMASLGQHNAGAGPSGEAARAC